jgi:chitinase
VSKRFPGRRLSVVRLVGVIVVVVGLVFAGVQGWRWLVDERTPTPQPWLAGYVDVTATPAYAFETPVSKAASNVVLSFVVADKTNPCVPSWGTYYSLDQAEASLDLDRRIARLQQQGGSAMVSFGGQANSELATVCTDADALQAAYAQVVTRYSLSTIDLDIEGSDLTDTASGARRATAIAALQKAQEAEGKPLAVWLTLPVSPTGLTADGTAAVSQMLAGGVDLAGVNLMTMDYGGALAAGQSMSAASIAALQATHDQLHTIYAQRGVELSSKTLWNKLGATPMIGQNDVPGEIFSLDDASALNAFAVANGVGRMSLWSLNRDQTCSANYPDVTQVSDSCSGVNQNGQSFATVLAAGFSGNPNESSDTVTTSEPTPTSTPAPSASALADDPATSPYQIWSPDVAYTAGTRVVWHHNVYVAKYYTMGDLPDDPVVQASATPWQLVGPVLPGETPAPVSTLPPGTYPDWSGTQVYTQGDRVTFDGGYYEAKWWTQGNSPAAAAANDGSSPWAKLTDDQVRAVLGLPPLTPEPTAPAG